MKGIYSLMSQKLNKFNKFNNITKQIISMQATDSKSLQRQKVKFEAKAPNSSSPPLGVIKGMVGSVSSNVLSTISGKSSVTSSISSSSKNNPQIKISP